MEKALSYLIETAPDKFYLAIWLKPYLTHANNRSLNILYWVLQQEAVREVPEAIQNVVMDCSSNERVLEVVNKMINTFYY